MSDICKKWYKDYKKRYDENINIWNTDKEKCCKKITGRGLDQNAWRMIRISGAVDRMGGFANFSHYVNKCAETDYQCFDEKVAEENKKLKAENEKLRECVEWYADEWNQINPNKARQTLKELE